MGPPSDGSGEEVADAFLFISGVPVYFSEDWDTGIGGGLWSTGLAMARYFERHADDVICNLKCLNEVKNSTAGATGGLSVLELGSGNGFLSVCLLALAAHQRIPLQELVVTDLVDHLPLMAQTLKANPHVWEKLTVVDDGDTATMYDGNLQKNGKQSSTPVTVAEHRWGEVPSSKSNNPSDKSDKKYDFIFGTDLAYRNSLHEPLIASLVRFSHQHTLILIGVTMTDTQPVFFDLLTKAEFRYEKLSDHLLEREFRGGNFGIVAIQKR
ncbi:hypothetical protein ACHAXT_006352 [Thalassiosira profunda]